MCQSRQKNGKAVPGKPFPKGHTGRPKGTHNKITIALIDDVIEAYHRKGGVDPSGALPGAEAD